MYQFGFLGLGKMGYSVLKGVLSKGLYDKSELAFYAPSEATQQKGKALGLALAEGERDLFESCKIVLLAVKPQKYEGAFAKLDGLDFSGKTIISLAPGKSIAYLKSIFKGARVARAMPNTPALIGRAVTTIASDDESIGDVTRIFASIGAYAVVEEKQIDEAIPMNGSMPAYLLEFAKTFIECGVANGFKEEDAKNLVLHSIIGSCELALQSEDSLDTLINNVCSKGGSTIAGLNQLRDNGFNESIQKCFAACVKRSKELADA